MDSNAYAILLQDTVSLIAGLYPFTHPYEVVKKVLKDPSLKFFKRGFSAELERYMVSIANSMKRNSALKIVKKCINYFFSCMTVYY